MAKGEITIKSKEEIAILREGGKRLSFILGETAKQVRVGITKQELNDFAEKLVYEGGDKPSFKNYKPDGAKICFPASLCVSVNDEIVHGIPDEYTLKDGDIVGIDLGLNHKGMFTDMAMTVGVGEVSESSKKLMEATEKALSAGIKAVKDGVYTGDIGNAIEKVAKASGYAIVEELSGHGVGYAVHEAPYIPNFGAPKSGVKLKAGMVIALEPMLALGKGGIKVAKDDFTFKTRDASRSAHFEKTLVVTESGCEILTQ